MDKDDSENLDVEYKRYLQIIKPYLGQLLDHEDIETCNSWIQRLSNCEEIEKPRRNKYLFTLCFQLANGVLTHPFTNPPPNELPMLFDDVNSDDSFSEAEANVNSSDNQNNIVGGITNTTSILLPSIFRSARSDVFTLTKRIESNLDNTKKASPSANNRLKNQPSTSSSTIGNSLVDFSELIQPEDNVYLRVNSLIDKLREMKKQNTILHKELNALKENYNRKNLPTQYIRPSVNCCTNTETNLEDSEAMEKDSTGDCKSYIHDYNCELEKNNQPKLLQVEKLKWQHKAEMIKLKTSLQEEIQMIQEKKIQAIKDEYDLKINNIKFKTEIEIDHLKKILNEIEAEKENLLVLKNQEINKLKEELEEVKTQNTELRNSFNGTNDSTPGKTNEKAFEFEKKLYKIEKAKNRRVKAYQAQLANLYYSKNVLDSSFHLQLLKQRTELIAEFTHENQKEVVATVEKLESKYKEIVANVQAAAIQRRIQDQIALETIIRAAFSKQNHFPHGTEDNFENLKTTTNVSDNSNNLLSSFRRHESNSLVEKKIASLDDSGPKGFCIDEIKLEELFERVNIPQKDTDADNLSQ